MTTEERRIESLHGHMAARRRARERRITAALRAGSGGLACFLLLLIYDLSGAHPARMAGLYSGATMLFEDAGSYVLLALGAFMAGVIITVLCIRMNRHEG